MRVNKVAYLIKTTQCVVHGCPTHPQQESEYCNRHHILISYETINSGFFKNTELKYIDQADWYIEPHPTLKGYYDCIQCHTPDYRRHTRVTKKLHTKMARLIKEGRSHKMIADILGLSKYLIPKLVKTTKIYE